MYARLVYQFDLGEKSTGVWQYSHRKPAAANTASRFLSRILYSGMLHQLEFLHVARRESPIRSRLIFYGL
jgi:hypothetical protein